MARIPLRLGERADLSVPRGTPHMGARYDADAFGRFSEAIARFLGTGRFLFWQSLLVAGWIILNTIGLVRHWDPYPFILLNLAFSTQAAYAAPLILLAQNRQDDRDRASIARDRAVAARTQSDTEFLARELAAVRLALSDVVTTQDLDDSLARLAERITGQSNGHCGPRTLAGAAGFSYTYARISSVSSFFATASRNEAWTPLTASPASAARSSPKAAAIRRYSSVSEVPNIGGSSLFSVTNRPSASRRGSGCAARSGTWPVQTLEVGHTSSGVWVSRSRATSRGSARQLVPCPIRSAPKPSSASQIVSGPLISPACGTLCSPAATAAPNTSRSTSACAARACSMPPSPRAVSAAGGEVSA